ncbi:MAG: HAD family hydrolase [Methylococcales bacterium]|nr:HAD family hydrolase [Methylococcales bacterium]
MSLAIFDLDNTLISDDSDYLWGQFLVDQGIVDKDEYEQTNLKFYQDYKQGKLDIVEFLHFSLAPLAKSNAEQLFKWREQFIEEVIKPIQLKLAVRLVNKHRFKGDTVLIITATNRFVTEPIAKLFGIDNLLATTPEFIDNQYTGQIEGIPCFQEGKVKLLKQWLKNSTETMENSWFYSDSHNDLSLLKLVDNPVAVDPDDTLREYAEKQDWSIISLRG